MCLPIRARKITLGLCLGLASCSGLRPEAEFPGFAVMAAGEAVELRATPFFPQEDYQCGPAALATVLSAAGTEVSPAELAPKIYLPGRKGSLQVELIAGVRRYGRLPYPIDPDPRALLAELKAGRPVLVLQNLGLDSYPVWHYAVVVGFDPLAEQFILRSGTEHRLPMSFPRFLDTWHRADYWGLVVLPSGELPARPNEQIYLQSVAALEGSGQLEAAALAYAKGLERWPDSVALRLGLGNAYYAQGKLAEAAKRFRELSERYPDNAAAYNNLAQVLAEQGCYETALIAVDTALSVSKPQDALYPVFQQTRAEIGDKQRNDSGYHHATSSCSDSRL